MQPTETVSQLCARVQMSSGRKHFRLVVNFTGCYRDVWKYLIVQVGMNIINSQNRQIYNKPGLYINPYLLIIQYFGNQCGSVILVINIVKVYGKCVDHK